MTTTLVWEEGQRVESLVYGQGTIIEAKNIPDGVFDEWGDADPSHWKVEFDNEHDDLDRISWANLSAPTPRRYRWFNEHDLCPDGEYRDPRDLDNQIFLEEYWGSDFWMQASLFIAGPKPKRTSGFGKWIEKVESDG